MTEQSRVSWMTDITKTFAKCGKCVVSPCTGALTTAKVCMMFLKY